MGAKNLGTYIRMHATMVYCAIWTAGSASAVLWMDWSEGVEALWAVYVLLAASLVVLVCCGGLLAWSVFLTWGGLTHIEYAQMTRRNAPRRSNLAPGHVASTWTVQDARALPFANGVRYVKEMWGVNGRWFTWFFARESFFGKRLPMESRKF